MYSDDSGWKLAFSDGHGSRFLCDMMGGEVYDVDLLDLEACEDEKQSDDIFKLNVEFLAKESDGSITFVPKYEQALLAHALDCLPCSSLSWSMHRG